MTEPDIAHAVKEILGVRVAYVFACFTLTRWINVRNNSEIKEKTSLCRLDPSASCFLEFMLQKIQLRMKTLGADISSVTFPEFFT